MRDYLLSEEEENMVSEAWAVEQNYEECVLQGEIWDLEEVTLDVEIRDADKLPF